MSKQAKSIEIKTNGFVRKHLLQLTTFSCLYFSKKTMFDFFKWCLVISCRKSTKIRRNSISRISIKSD